MPVRGEALSEADEDVKRRGLAGVIRDLHAEIDRATAEAYGWPHDLPEDEILARLVALNAERAAEEAAGHVRWLRPEYQIPRFGKGASASRACQKRITVPIHALLVCQPDAESPPKCEFRPASSERWKA